MLAAAPRNSAQTEPGHEGLALSLSLFPDRLSGPFEDCWGVPVQWLDLASTGLGADAPRGGEGMWPRLSPKPPPSPQGLTGQGTLLPSGQSSFCPSSGASPQDTHSG